MPSIDWIKQKKLCPFMSDGTSKVYCSPECALVSTYKDPSTGSLIGTVCTLNDHSDIIQAIIEKQTE